MLNSFIKQILDKRKKSLDKILIPPTMSTTRPGLRSGLSGSAFLKEWKYSMSPRDPSVKPGQKTGIRF